MNVGHLKTVNTFMHIMVFLELAILASSAPIGLLVAPEATGNDKPLLLPEAPSSGEFAVGLAAATFVGICLLTPALWVICTFTSQRKAHTRKLGYALLALSVLFAIGGWPPEADATAANAIAASIVFGCGSLLITGLFLLVYSKRIEQLDASVLYGGSSADAEQRDEINETFSAETRQLFSRLFLFVLSILIAFGITFLLGRFTQFEKQPMYLTFAFFGMLGTAMLVTGLIDEKTLVAFVPWANQKKS